MDARVYSKRRNRFSITITEQQDKDMKLYFGKKRLAMRKLKPGIMSLYSDRKALQQLAKLKVGDYVAGCTGGNFKIAKMIFYYERAALRNSSWRKPLDTYVLCEIDFFNEHGGSHTYPGCAWPAVSAIQVNEWYKEYVAECIASNFASCNGPKEVANIKAMAEHLSTGQMICDEHGVVLEQFR